MRKLLPVLALFATATLAFAQGRIVFENDSLHLVYMTTDTTRLAPSDVDLAGQPAAVSVGLSVDLWGGTSSTVLSKLATTTLNAPGRFGPVNVALPFLGGSPDYFQVQVYATAAGSYAAANAGTGLYYGESVIFTCTPGTLTPNSIVGSSSTWPPGPFPIPGSGMGSIMLQLNPVPEPSVLALLGLAGVLGRAWRRKC